MGSPTAPLGLILVTLKIKFKVTMVTHTYMYVINLWNSERSRTTAVRYMLLTTNSKSYTCIQGI